MKVLKFKNLTRHGRHEFLSTPKYGFEDEAVANYFVAAGWAAETTGEPDKVFGEDEITFDPETRSNETGKLVVQDSAADVAAE